MPTIDERSRLLSGAEGGFLLKNARKTAANANHDAMTTLKASVGQNSRWRIMISSTRFQRCGPTYAELLLESSAPLTHHHPVQRQNDRAEHVSHSCHSREPASARERQSN